MASYTSSLRYQHLKGFDEMKTTNISVALEIVRKMAIEEIEFALVHKNGIYEIVEILECYPYYSCDVRKFS